MQKQSTRNFKKGLKKLMNSKMELKIIGCNTLLAMRNVTSDYNELAAQKTNGILDCTRRGVPAAQWR